MSLPAWRVEAQSIDATIEQQIEDGLQSDVTSTVEDEVEQQLESDMTGAVEEQIQEQVESDVANTVEEQVQSDVAGTVEQQVEQGVAATVEQQIESGVLDNVERQVESGVTETVQDDLAAGVGRTIEQQLADVLGTDLDDDLGDLARQLRELAGALGIEDVEGAIRRAAEAVADAADTDGTGGGATASGSSGTETYAAGVDGQGRTIEREVWVILVPAEHAARIQNWGFTVRERRDLEVLDRVLLRVDAPEDRDIAEAALELAIDAPGTSVDFNHIYTGAAAQAEGVSGAIDESARIDTTIARKHSLSIGIVDSEIAAEHEALSGGDITQQDFVPFAAPRPRAHGTAVASLLIGDSAGMHGALRGARLHAASVFCEDDAGNEIATTSSLVTALEWLVSRGVEVVNMSLMGPPNRVLEAAVEAAAERGSTIVAAVGNNGPNGEPLYPAAYEAVIGVTAVDSGHRVYHYANRGPQVTFAAPGVDVPVARSDGGYATQSGTSMAAPRAAAIITMSLARAGRKDALAILKASALDLGEKDFDEVYGFGLITAIDSPSLTGR